MDAAGYLKRQGWRGDGHSLDHTGRGIRKPLLVSKKVDVLGVGVNKHAAVSDQWWMRAFDQSLKDLGTGKKSALDDVRTKGMAYGGLYGRFVKGEGVPGTFGEEKKRKREEDVEGKSEKVKKVKMDTKSAQKALDRQVKAFVHEAIRRGLISTDEESKPAKKTTRSSPVSLYGEETVLEIFKEAGLSDKTSLKDFDKQQKLSAQKQRRAVKRAARAYLLSKLSPEERAGIEESGSSSEEKRNQKSRQSGGKNDTVGVAAKESKAAKKAERRQKKQTSPGQKENVAPQGKDTSESDDSTSETNDVGFVVDTTGDANLVNGISTSETTISVIDSDGNVRFTCKPGGDVPLDPTIWTGLKPKLLPRPVREARRKYMEKKRDERNERKGKSKVSSESDVDKSKAVRKYKDAEALTVEILKKSRSMAAKGKTNEKATIDGMEVGLVKDVAKQGSFTKEEMALARKKAKRALKDDKVKTKEDG